MPDWIFQLIGITLVTIGVAVFLWAAMSDRSRGRKRCPKCWYSMTGVRLVCPECGKAVTSERELFRTRRRGRWMGIAVAVLGLGIGFWITPVVQRSGWVGLVPSSVLVYAAPMDGAAGVWGSGTESALLKELYVRAATGRLSPRQWRVCLRRTAMGQPRAWAGIVRTRAKWPAGEEVRASIAVPPVLAGRNNELVVRVRLKGEEKWAERRMMLRVSDLLRDMLPQVIGVAPEGVESIEVEAQIVLGVKGIYDDHGRCVGLDMSKAFVAWEGVVDEVDVGGTAEMIMRGIKSVEADDIVRALSPALVRREGTVQLALTTPRPTPGADGMTPLADWDLGALVEVRRDGVRVARGKVRYHMDARRWTRSFGEPVYMPLTWEDQRPAPGALPSGKWVIRLIGDAGVALSELDRSLYWAGEVTVPVTRVEEEVAPRGE